MKKLISLAFAALGLAAAAVPYKVIVPIPGASDGELVYIYNYDTSEKMDSVAVADQQAVFTGIVDDPIPVRLVYDGEALGALILEEGTTAYNVAEQKAVGTMINDASNAIIEQINDNFRKILEMDDPNDQEAAYQNFIKSVVLKAEENMDTPIGYMLFLDIAPSLDAVETIAIADKYPQLKKYTRVQKLLSAAENRLATMEGRPFVDFEVTYDGTTHRLSDLVGKGDYVLVDFWASWCRPCREEMPFIKKIYNEYSDKGLKVLGVAVWDEPANTLEAVRSLELPWEIWPDAQRIPTDIYGISGIPCIIVFGPDGTIVARDVRGNELVEKVASFYE